LAKVVRAFSIDPDVARMIDRIAEKESTWHKKPNKSKVVNRALRWYYLESDMSETIHMFESQAQYWRKESTRLSSNGGVKHHLRGLFKALFRAR
jgi:hypothetical protein